jgi:hypothetical protein
MRLNDGFTNLALQPKLKKLQNIGLSADTVRERMKSIGYDLYDISLDKSTQDMTVTREYMSNQYGRSAHSTFPKISKKNLALHGLDNFMYLNLDFNPHAPQVPGAPGLFFDVNSDSDTPPSGDERPSTMRLFSRIQRKVWLYCGQYLLKRVASLTKEEWAEQLPKVGLLSSPV